MDKLPKELEDILDTLLDRKPKIKLIRNGDATVVIYRNRKAVAKKMKDDTENPYYGLSAALLKVLGYSGQDVKGILADFAEQL